MKRVAELSASELNAETRPYRIVGWQEGNWAIEYLDVYEYDYEWHPEKIAKKVSDGWGIIFAYGDSEGTLYQCLRRVVQCDELCITCQKEPVDTGSKLCTSCSVAIVRGAMGIYDLPYPYQEVINDE